MDQLISTKVLLRSPLGVRVSCVVPRAQQYLQEQGAAYVSWTVLRHIPKRAEPRCGTNSLVFSGCSFRYFKYASQIFRGFIQQK